MWKIAGGILLALAILVISGNLLEAARLSAAEEVLREAKADMAARERAQRAKQAAELQIPRGHECRAGMLFKRVENGWEQASGENDPRCR